MAIDVDVTGNSARSVGTIDNCARIDSSGSNQLEIDIVLPDPGIPADLGIKAWQFQLLYDEKVVKVTKEDTNFLLTQAPGSSLLTGLSDAVPDSDGRFTSAAIDFGEAYQIEPEGVQEVGPGIITRITLTGVAPGTTDLSLDKVKLLRWDDPLIPIGDVFPAAVSVDMPCEPPPGPAAPGTGSPAAGDAGTPLPGTPGAEPTDVTPGAETPLPGTPAGDETPGAATAGPGTPVSEEQVAAGGEPEAGGETDGGGLGAGAWAGIGVGIAAALAAAGAGWFVLRRRQAGSE